MTHFDSQFKQNSHIANLLAQDYEFLRQIGLDAFEPLEILTGLNLIVGFILAMYNSAKTIFSLFPTFDLDEKLIRLIYSRVVLFPQYSQKPLTPDIMEPLDEAAYNFAIKCFNDIKSEMEKSSVKWDDAPLGTKFFEICARVLVEEDIADADYFKCTELVSEINKNPVYYKIATRSVLAVAFSRIFSHLSWELN